VSPLPLCVQTLLVAGALLGLCSAPLSAQEGQGQPERKEEKAAGERDDSEAHAPGPVLVHRFFRMTRYQVSPTVPWHYPLPGRKNLVDLSRGFSCPFAPCHFQIIGVEAHRVFHCPPAFLDRIGTRTIHPRGREFERMRVRQGFNPANPRPALSESGAPEENLVWINSAAIRAPGFDELWSNFGQE
jgi:hypothetical protein